jgi:hypothetical protein
MLVDFLKGNHFAIDIATVSWLWGTKVLGSCTLEMSAQWARLDSHGVFMSAPRGVPVRVSQPQRRGPRARGPQ